MHSINIINLTNSRKHLPVVTINYGPCFLGRSDDPSPALVKCMKMKKGCQGQLRVRRLRLQDYPGGK